MQLAFGLTISLLLFIGCTSKNTIAKQQVKNKQFIDLQSLIDTNNYKVDITTVYPFNTQGTTEVLNSILLQAGGANASRIDVTTDRYFIEVSDTVSKADLPFFGERRISSGYGNNSTGIEFNGPMLNLKKEINQKKRTITISFNISNNTENYTVFIVAYSNQSVTVNINSSQTTNISYAGKLSQLGS